MMKKRISVHIEKIDEDLNSLSPEQRLLAIAKTIVKCMPGPKLKHVDRDLFHRIEQFKIQQEVNGVILKSTNYYRSIESQNIGLSLLLNEFYQFSQQFSPIGSYKKDPHYKEHVNDLNLNVRAFSIFYEQLTTVSRQL